MKICSIEGCGDLALAHGWCKRHYNRWYRTGNPLGKEKRKKTLAQCEVPECGKTARYQGLCEAHYRKQRLYSDPLGGQAVYDGMTRAHPREWSSWIAMKQRCYNPKANGYQNYGGRGLRYARDG